MSGEESSRSNLWPLQGMGLAVLGPSELAQLYSSRLVLPLRLPTKSNRMTLLVSEVALRRKSILRTKPSICK